MKKQTIILIILAILIVGAIYYFESTKVKPMQELGGDAAQSTEELTQPLLKEGKYPLAPELTGIVGYINAEEGLQLHNLRGKVVLVDFWTYSCINCIRTLPHLVAWDKQYRDQGLVIVGVHTPEFDFEKEIENVRMATEKYGIKYPVVQDNNYATWNVFKNRYWPHKYLIDAEGYIRYDHIGEGSYEETELKIQELLAEINADVEDIAVANVPDQTPTKQTTPELYAGYGFALNRGQDVGNKEGLQPDRTIDYNPPEQLQPDIIYLQGAWQSNKDNLEAKEVGASILLNYLANDVNIVAMDGDAELEVFIDGSYITSEMAGDDVQFDGERSFMKIDEPRLYNVVDGDYERRILKLKVSKSGFSFHAFTFG